MPSTLEEMADFSILAGALGIVVTDVYMAGLLERRDPAAAGIGIDSIAVTLAYLGGLRLLFTGR